MQRCAPGDDGGRAVTAIIMRFLAWWRDLSRNRLSQDDGGMLTKMLCAPGGVMRRGLSCVSRAALTTIAITALTALNTLTALASTNTRLVHIGM